MLKKDKVDFIIEKLDEIYPDVSPPLKHQDTYTLLIAVLLSANTTDKSVNRVTPKLFKKANTPTKMAKLDYETIYNIIKPCGLGPAKANAILELSKILVKNGYAFDYAVYSKKKYSQDEEYAKVNKLGLWNMKFEYPWQWRKKIRDKK